MSAQIVTVKYNENNVPYISLGAHEIRLESEQPTEAVLEKARVELREQPEITGPAIAELREMLKGEKTLHVPTDDEFLKMYLRPCKYYPKSAFDRIKTFFKLKQKHPELYEDLYPNSVIHVYEQELVKLVPTRDRNGSRILVIQCGKKWKPSKCSLNDLFRAIQVAIAASMLEPTTQICGGCVILDFDGLSLSHIMQFTPSFAALVLTWVQDSLSLRLKSVHIVNNSYLFNMLFAIFKPFIREKLRKRIHFHGRDMSSLHRHFDVECLPSMYGGKVDIPDGTGVALGDLFRLYSKEFEMANSFGYDSPARNSL
ncbi:alpha-tocopherol transfer protein [Sitodiplosis mosellana]|uniref:alpha-tocopherol transfer protein n=1 Tax=Sitodiplosis mosellana TaxID=263140 RepID=UPI002444A1CF|nr:alpha-tocopherol transfer protein [Sitodiplosis mosellana]